VVGSETVKLRRDQLVDWGIVKRFVRSAEHSLKQMMANCMYNVTVEMKMVNEAMRARGMEINASTGRAISVVGM
jgi:hypothetical protein